MADITTTPTDTTPTGTAPTSTTRGLSAPLLVGGAFLLSTGVGLAFQVVAAIFELGGDRARPEGPLESLIDISLFGTVGLAVALLLAWALRNRAGAGAIVLGALAVITLPLFWSGMPAAFGATAAWRAGLTKDGRPRTGAARGFGVVGLVVAILEIVVLIALNIGGALTM